MTSGNGRSDVYMATLAQLRARRGNRSVLGIKVLMWALYLERPPRGEEPRYALGVAIGFIDLDTESISALKTLLLSRPCHG